MPRIRSHELDEELDECFLDFLNAHQVQGSIRQTANDARRSVTFNWMEADDAEPIDISEFPAFLAVADPELFDRTQRRTV